jgi:hypothetical protein
VSCLTSPKDHRQQLGLVFALVDWMCSAVTCGRRDLGMLRGQSGFRGRDLLLPVNVSPSSALYIFASSLSQVADHVSSLLKYCLVLNLTPESLATLQNLIVLYIYISTNSPAKYLLIPANFGRNGACRSHPHSLHCTNCNPTLLPRPIFHL